MKSISSPVKQILLFAAVLICSWTASTTDVSAGSLEPPAAPAPTMRTLEEQKPAWNKIIPANQRFVDALDGSAVLDKETGLVWAKSASIYQADWDQAIDYATDLELGGRKGWRLPTVDELASLIDTTQQNPALPSGHPFQSVSSSVNYWTSSTYDKLPANAWNIKLSTGEVLASAKSYSFYVWPVRGGR